MTYEDTMRDAGRDAGGRHLGVRTHTVPRPTCPECGSDQVHTYRDPAARGQTLVTTVCLACEYVISVGLDV